MGCGDRRGGGEHGEGKVRKERPPGPWLRPRGDKEATMDPSVGRDGAVVSTAEPGLGQRVWSPVPPVDTPDGPGGVGPTPRPGLLGGRGRHLKHLLDECCIVGENVCLPWTVLPCECKCKCVSSSLPLVIPDPRRR